MLSILIPTYNTKLVDLVDDPNSQCRNLNIDFEILCCDDDSLSKFRYFNSKINEYKNVMYKEMKENLSRAKIRNLMAIDAKYGKLLFIDKDSGIIRDKSIFTYIKQLSDDVIYGSRLYQISPPEDKNKILESVKFENKHQT